METAVVARSGLGGGSCGAAGVQRALCQLRDLGQLAASGWLPRGNLRGPGWGRRRFLLTPPFAHRARMLVPTPAQPRTPWAAPAAGCTSPSWRCPSSLPCLGTAACAPGTGCGFAVRPGAALRPALAGPSTTGQSQVWASCGLVDSTGPWEAAEGQQGEPTLAGR